VCCCVYTRICSSTTVAFGLIKHTALVRYSYHAYNAYTAHRVAHYTQETQHCANDLSCNEASCCSWLSTLYNMNSSCLNRYRLRLNCDHINSRAGTCKKLGSVHATTQPKMHE
jgi:hypothetical protein